MAKRKNTGPIKSLVFAQRTLVESGISDLVDNQGKILIPNLSSELADYLARLVCADIRKADDDEVGTTSDGPALLRGYLGESPRRPPNVDGI